MNGSRKIRNSENDDIFFVPFLSITVEFTRGGTPLSGMIGYINSSVLISWFPIR